MASGNRTKTDTSARVSPHTRKGRRRSGVWRVVRIVLVVLAILIVLAVVFVGTYVVAKIHRFNKVSQVEAFYTDRDKPYTRPETQEPIHDVNEDEWNRIESDGTESEPEPELPTEPPVEPTASPSESVTEPSQTSPTDTTVSSETDGPTTAPATQPPETATDPVRDGIMWENGKLVYYENGRLTGAGLIRWNGDYYFVRPSGSVVRSETYEVTDGKGLLPAGRYVFDSDGKILRNADSEQSINGFHNSTGEVDVFGDTPIYRVAQQDPDVRNVLLLGTDSRDVSKERGNSDVMIVLSINRKEKTIRLVSVLRDVLVPIEGHDWNRINAAYRLGGAGLAVNTVNEAFGLDIQEFVVADFNGVIELIDRIGGIDVRLTQTEVDYYHETFPNLFGADVTAGVVRLSGAQALTHLRNRTIGTDFERTRRQRDVMEAMLNRVLTQNLLQLNSTLDFVLEIIRTNVNATDFLSVGVSVISNLSSGIRSLSVPERSQQGKEYRFAVYNGMTILKLISPEDPSKADFAYAERKVREFLYARS